MLYPLSLHLLFQTCTRLYILCSFYEQICCASDGLIVLFLPSSSLSLYLPFRLSLTLSFSLTHTLSVSLYLFISLSLTISVALPLFHVYNFSIHLINTQRNVHYPLIPLRVYTHTPYEFPLSLIHTHTFPSSHKCSHVNKHTHTHVYVYLPFYPQTNAVGSVLTATHTTYRRIWNSSSTYKPSCRRPRRYVHAKLASSQLS